MQTDRACFKGLHMVQISSDISLIRMQQKIELFHLNLAIKYLESVFENSSVINVLLDSMRITLQE